MHTLVHVNITKISQVTISLFGNPYAIFSIGVYFRAGQYIMLYLDMCALQALSVLFIPVWLSKSGKEDQ